MTILDRVEALERRLQAAEDRLEIMDVIHAYGPAVDTGDAEATAALFTDSGVYDVDTGLLTGREEIAAMVAGDPHQGLIAGGCGHLMTAPQIDLAGDAATVRSYSQLVVRRPDGRGYGIARLTANRWDLSRTDAGWAVVRRTARLVDGSGESRAVLGANRV